MKTGVSILGCLFIGVVSVFGWGAEGHQAIAAAAFGRLDTAAKTAAASIMATSSVPELKNLATAATWPDDIRQSATPSHSGHLFKIGDKNALDFDKRYPTNRLWHFINYPLDGSYTLAGPFSSADDAAHAIGHCIDVLEGNAQGKWSALRQDEALAWLIHLVGDIHQPLHVGEGFYEFDGKDALLISDPVLALQFKNQDDAGGNELYYTATEEFHGFWDKVMVTTVSPNPVQLVNLVLAAAFSGNFTNTGDYHHWAEAWATQSIQAAKEAYAPLVTGEQNRIGTRSGHGPKIMISLDTQTYKTQFEYLVKQQLGKAAYDLADLLNHIQWK